MDHSLQNEASFYSKMSMDTTTKLTTLLIGFVVMLGVPLIGGISYSLKLNNPYFLLLLIPFAVILAGTKAYAPYGIGIRNGKLIVFRLIGPLSYDLLKLKSVKRVQNLREELGLALRMWGTSGLWGSYGKFWSKKVGNFNVHITRNDKLTFLEFTDGKKLLLSPDKQNEFIQRINK